MAENSNPTQQEIEQALKSGPDQFIQNLVAGKLVKLAVDPNTGQPVNGPDGKPQYLNAKDGTPWTPPAAPAEPVTPAPSAVVVGRGLSEQQLHEASAQLLELGLGDGVAGGPMRALELLHGDEPIAPWERVVAEQQLIALKRDTEWGRKFLAGDRQARSEFNRLTLALSLRVMTRKEAMKFDPETAAAWDWSKTP